MLDLKVEGGGEWVRKSSVGVSIATPNITHSIEVKINGIPKSKSTKNVTL